MLSKRPRQPLLVRLSLRLAYRASTIRTNLSWAWRVGRAPRLTLPRDRDRVLVGRGPACDCTIGQDTVSRRHALLWQRAGGWKVEDLGSLNGTRVNGWPVVIPTEVRAGDIVSFGGASYRVADR